MSEYNYEAESFEAFIRFYEAEIRAVHGGGARAKDFTASFRRCMVNHGVVTQTGYRNSWVVTPEALVVLGVS